MKKIWDVLNKETWTEEGQKELEKLSVIISKISDNLSDEELNFLAIKLDEGKDMEIYDLIVMELTNRYPKYEKYFLLTYLDTSKK